MRTLHANRVGKGPVGLHRTAREGRWSEDHAPSPKAPPTDQRRRRQRRQHTTGEGGATTACTACLKANCGGKGGERRAKVHFRGAVADNKWRGARRQLPPCSRGAVSALVCSKSVPLCRLPRRNGLVRMADVDVHRCHGRHGRNLLLLLLVALLALTSARVVLQAALDLGLDAHAVR